MKLHYFDFYARAEPIRFLAAHAKLPLENVYMTFEEWPTAKTSGLYEFGQLPMLEIEGKQLVESWSILRYLGRLYGYYSDEDLEAAYRIDSILDSCEDFMRTRFKFTSEQDADRKQTGKDFFYNTYLPMWVKAIEKRIASNVSQKHAVGAKVTIADFGLAATIFDFLYN